MIDYPRLREPLLSVILAGMFTVLTMANTTDLLRLFLGILACVFAAISMVTGADWAAWHISERVRDMSTARTAGPERYALALKGLTMSQTDMVQRQMGMGIIGIPGEPGPTWYIRGDTVDIPYLYVCDFFEWSKRTYPYLWPVRDGAEVGGGDGWSNGVQYATEITRVVVKLGWASEARGIHAAVLTDPLEQVAVRLGVEL